MAGIRAFFIAAILAVFLAPSSSHSEPCTTKTGDALEVCHTFAGGDNDGEFPQAGVTIDTDGTLFGTTFGGFVADPGRRCTKSCGNAYHANADGGASQIFAFDGATSGSFPAGELLIAKNGNLYGTTEYGPGTGCGGLGCGSLFKFSKDGSNAVSNHLCMLDACGEGINPHAGLVSDERQQEHFYGTATFGGTGYGWLCGNSYGGCGTVFEVDDQGSALTAVPLYSFCQKSDCKDGAVPSGRLLLDTRPGQPLRFFGTTEYGGAHARGVIFQLTCCDQNGNWKEKILYSFCSLANCSDGTDPETGLIMDSNGTLYGTTALGGAHTVGDPTCANEENGLGCGTVFRLDPPYKATNYHSLHLFTGGVGDGQEPQGELVLNGNTLYGTTLVGGGTHCGHTNGCGVLFSLPATGGATTILHSFGAASQKVAQDGAHPNGALKLLDVQGNRYLYGVARDKGLELDCCGTLYRYKIQ